MIAPIFLTVGGVGGFLALQQMGDSLGQYKVDTVLDKAATTQKDMKANYYGGKKPLILVSLTEVQVQWFLKRQLQYLLVYLDQGFGMFAML